MPSLVAPPEQLNPKTLIIDDVIEFEVKTPAPPAEQPVRQPPKPDPAPRRAPLPAALQALKKPGQVLVPHKLELTEPEPVPLTDTKGSKHRTHAACGEVCYLSENITILHPVNYIITPNNFLENLPI